MNAASLAALTLTPRTIAPSAWWEHVPTAHWLIATLQPTTVVELGSHHGVSFFAFCEAAQAFSPATFVYAVDSWQGDAHAGLYGEPVYARVRAQQQQQHSQRSRLVRSDFDAAAGHFGEASIDLLHIDGLHTLEAVRHDWQTWRPKLKDGGTVLLHDTNVRERDFGVWQLWRELSADPALSCLEIRHGHGLGIVTLAPSPPGWHGDLRQVLPALAARGALLDELASLKPQGHEGSENARPYREQAEELWHALQQLRQEHAQLQTRLQEQGGSGRRWRRALRRLRPAGGESR